MATISLSLENLGDNLGAAVLRSRDLSRVLDKASKRHLRRVERHFDNESSAGSISPPGGSWPDWSESYKKRRKSGKKLDLTGALRASIDYSVSGGNTLAIGSRVVYSRGHDLGNPDGNLPMRKFLSFHQEDVDKTLNDCWEFILTGMVPNA